MITKMHAGFSLIEALVVVSIIAVLAGLSVSVAGKFRQQADSVKCLSNLREIAGGILAYCNDHENRLPGPVHVGQYPYKNNSTQLAYHLASYLNLSRDQYKVARRDVFVCPANARALPWVGYAPVYAMNVKVEMADSGQVESPFGYQNDSNPGLFGTKINAVPMRLHRLTEIKDGASKTLVMKDADAGDSFYSEKGLKWASSLPKRPVHGDHRIGLFFDWHAARLEIQDERL